MVKWKADAITGFILLLVSIASFFHTFRMEIGAVTDIPSATPGYYVRLWVTLLGVLSILLIISSYRRRNVEDRMNVIWYKLGVLTSIALALYLFLIPYLGFVISSILFTGVLIVAYSYKMGKYNCAKAAKIKLLLLNVAVAVVVAFACDQLFSNILKVMLPRFSLF